MTEFYDLCLRETSEEMEQLAEELGWTATNCGFDTVFLEADEWGELKRKIGEARSDADVLVFRGGDEELNRKAAGDSRIDILLHPERGRKDSGIDHVVAEKAAENRVAIGFDLQRLRTGQKKQSHVLKHWRRNLKLCDKYDTPYIVTSGARDRFDLKAPRDLAAVIGSLGYKGSKGVSKYPEQILTRAEEVQDDGFVRPGVEKGGEG
ncbi:MAG: RNase P subunit p30 family protein [Candidatus Nanohaloarchaea archaeon]